MEEFEGGGDDFILDALGNFEPMKGFEDGCDVAEFRGSGDSACG